MRPHSAVYLRGLLAVLIGISLAWAVWTFAAILFVDGLSMLDIASILVFSLLALWLAQSFWSHMAGMVRETRRRFGSRPPPAILGEGPRVALLMPIYNEEVQGVFARIAAMWEDLQAHGQAERFDIFILSDTNDPEIWLQEIEAWRQLRLGLEAGGRVFYRRRLNNSRRKIGNLDDFVGRWGGHYGYIVPLDADSLVGAETLIELVARMDAQPAVGLIQVPPKLIKGRTLFARSLQFAGEMVGNINAAGVSAWSGPDGNYWGHNAIIRMSAFADLCGLPTFPGRPPFGGDILSHDFVEAALLRRGGFEVRIADDLGQSYEEPPPGIEDYLSRDRRWCQGNLQHVRVLAARDLRLTSRLHIFIGIMAYLTAPIWLVFLLLSAAQGFELAYGTPIYFTEEMPFPVLPSSVAKEAERLLFITLGWLFLPKILGACLAIAEPSRRRLLGGAPAIVLSFVLEIVISVLLAPIMMLKQTWFVLSILLGGVIDWRPQRRDSDNSSIMALQRRFLLVQSIGIAAAVAIWFLARPLFWWLLPVCLGPAIAPYLVACLESKAIGDWLRRHNLLLTQEEAGPVTVIERLDQWRAKLSIPSSKELLQSVLIDPRTQELHIELLQGQYGRCDGTIAAIAGHVGPGTLNKGDLLDLLADPDTLRSVKQAAWTYWSEEALEAALAVRGKPALGTGAASAA